MFWKADEYSAALTTAHRDATADAVRRHEQERSALVEALTTGGHGDLGSVWEIAGRLELPSTGTFATVAAEVSTVGSVAVPEIASKLRAANVSSAWRLLPDVEVGVVSLPGPDPSDVVRIVGAAAPARVGISPVYPALEESPRAFYLARIALQSAPRGAPSCSYTPTPSATGCAASRSTPGATWSTPPRSPSCRRPCTPCACCRACDPSDGHATLTTTLPRACPCST